jgi:hypothetical protein
MQDMRAPPIQFPCAPLRKVIDHILQAMDLWSYVRNEQLKMIISGGPKPVIEIYYIHCQVYEWV